MPSMVTFFIEISKFDYQCRGSTSVRGGADHVVPSLKPSLIYSKHNHVSGHWTKMPADICCVRWRPLVVKISTLDSFGRPRLPSEEARTVCRLIDNQLSSETNTSTFFPIDERGLLILLAFDGDIWWRRSRLWTTSVALLPCKAVRKNVMPH